MDEKNIPEKIEKSKQKILMDAYLQNMMNVNDEKDKRHEFWETQPVSQFNDKLDINVNEPLKPSQSKNLIPTDSLILPDEFYWSDLDINDSNQLDEIYQLLANHYVADKDMMFRFDYSKNFLYWVHTYPGYRKNWSLGVRIKDTNELVGYISAVPIKISINQNEINMVEINYLCLKSYLRGKRMAPLLIQEITRRANQKGIFQAVHTAGLLFSKPVSRTSYLHRNINVKKLVQVKFYVLPSTMTLKMAEKFYHISDENKLAGFRPLKNKDVTATNKLLSDYLSKYKLHPIFNETIFRHKFMSKNPDIVYSYVVENNGIITDFISFYVINSSILNHPTHKTLKVAYLYYHARTVTPMDELVNEVFIEAKKLGFDVFNILNVMDDLYKYKNLKLGKGDGVLNYYIYNWKCAPLDPIFDIGLMIK